MRPPHQALDEVERALRKLRKNKRSRKGVYRIPSLWVSEKKPLKSLQVDPATFFLDAIRSVKSSSGARVSKPRGFDGGEWSRDAVVYNVFVRTTTAFDHNNNGRLDLRVGDDSFRETGTFLKAIALLPYIKRLGANTIHLLPVTSIGHDGNKGTLGSPYAIRNPYTLDENLSEPCLGLDVRTEFKAFVEAAHAMGFRVVVEFVFRTAAKDADWVKDHPEWFYWIRDEIQPRDPHHLDEQRYGSPIFRKEELEHIHRQVQEHRFDTLLPPHQVYRDFFTAPPERVESGEGRYAGITREGARVKIPGAFADWPPDDNQPPWGDVTYLRMYEHPDFNYIAYNTIRMYDGRLARAENTNRPLWDKIVGIIPYYQHEFHIDGVMIDMGHALPLDLKTEIVKAARTLDSNFAFWDENFSITQRSREEGYNAVFGFLWVDEHHPQKMKAFTKRCSVEGFPIPYFATPENHNTPRAAARPGGVAYARWAWAINCFLPAIPFLHSGYELAETYPINTGLDFTHEQLRHLPSERLPLFSEYGYDWMNKNQFTAWISSIAKIRKRYRGIIADVSPNSFMTMQEANHNVLAFARMGQEPKKRIAIVSNMNFQDSIEATVGLETTRQSVLDLIKKKRIAVRNHSVRVTLKPGQCLVFEF